jgi:hypothetical protein
MNVGRLNGILTVVVKLLGALTDAKDALGLPKVVKQILQGGRSIGAWDQTHTIPGTSRVAKPFR